MKIDLDKLPEELLAKFLLTEGGPSAWDRYNEIKELCEIAGIPCQVNVEFDPEITGIEIDEASVTMTGDMWKQVMDDIKNIDPKIFRGAKPDEFENQD